MQCVETVPKKKFPRILINPMNGYQGNVGIHSFSPLEKFSDLFAFPFPQYMAM